jgi:His/Glu/Gln/Arg/opine family amino acid ABC transporter permease subunit
MDFGFVATNLRYLLNGLGVTVALAALSFAGCLVVGIALALLRLSPWRWLRLPTALYIDVMRMVPLIMVIFWFFFLLPILIGRPIDAFVAGLAGLVAFHSTYIAEVMRAGIQAVPRGLTEASRSSGMSYRHCMWYVVLPVAVRNMLPALVNRFVALFMGTVARLRDRRHRLLPRRRQRQHEGVSPLTRSSFSWRSSTSRFAIRSRDSGSISNAVGNRSDALMGTFDDEAFVAQAAPMLGFTLDDERRRAVAVAFAAYRDAAALLMPFPLPAGTEPASVYTLEGRK